MVRMIILGLWACLIALGSLFFSIRFNSTAPTAPLSVNNNVIKGETEAITIPIMIEGALRGYIICQLIYVIDKDAAQSTAISPGVFINDAVFSGLFGAYSDARRIENIQFGDVKQQIIDTVNHRLGKALLKNLFVKQFTYLPKALVDKIQNKEILMPSSGK